MKKEIYILGKGDEDNELSDLNLTVNWESRGAHRGTPQSVFPKNGAKLSGC